MVNYTWTVDSLETSDKDGLERVIVRSRFTVEGKKENTPTVLETHVVDLLPASPDNFIPYDNISKEQIVLWLKDALGPEKVNKIEFEIASLMEAMIPKNTE